MVNPDGTVEYTPDAGSSGADSYTYEVCDPSLSCASATVFITVSDLPEPPDAVDNVTRSDEDTSVTVDVSATTPTPRRTSTHVGHRHRRSVRRLHRVNPDGSIDYTPDPTSRARQLHLQVCDTTPVPVGPVLTPRQSTSR